MLPRRNGICEVLTITPSLQCANRVLEQWFSAFSDPTPLWKSALKSAFWVKGFSVHHYNKIMTFGFLAYSWNWSSISLSFSSGGLPVYVVLSVCLTGSACLCAFCFSECLFVVVSIKPEFGVILVSKPTNETFWLNKTCKNYFNKNVFTVIVFWVKLFVFRPRDGNKFSTKS